MIRNDYLMRAIQQLSQAFGQLIAGKDAESPTDSLDIIEAHIADALNTRREFLFSQDIATVGEFDPRLAAELGRMFALHARVALKTGRADLAPLSTAWAFRCLIRALGQIDTPSALLAEAELTSMLRHDVTEIHGAQFALPAYVALFDFARRTKRVSRAEDSLFAAISLGAPSEIVNTGRQFFAGLLDLDDGELAQYQTSRDEIRELLDELDS
ncbi:MAG: DUF6483 family protein [bacterium]